MAEELLDVGFDIHGGGNDLIFPHHENEAAQTRCARGAELARIWMHNGMLQLSGEKMAKSVGNIASLPEAIQSYGRDALIMFFSGGHYRQPIQFRDDTLADAAGRVRRVREVARRLVDGPSPTELAGFKERFFEALADDYNTPQALAALFEWVREANKAPGPVGRDDLAEMLEVLGLENLLEAEAGGGPPADVRELAARREAARAAKDFAKSDRLRDEIQAAGWVVRDGPDGPELLPAP
jgi:cysteinyl-tRNA synthetase